MEQLTHLIFFLNIAWLTAHELDAIQQQEWRVLPLTCWMDAQRGYQVFVLAHIPLMVMILIGLDSPTFQIGFDIFLLVHIGLHWRFRKHPLYSFNDRLSRFLIVGVAPFACLHLFLLTM